MSVKIKNIIVMAISLLIIFENGSLAGWFVFHKPTYKGKIIDNTTNKPLEGVGVSAAYYAKYLGIAEGHSVGIKIYITETDANGEFIIPTYTTIMGPFGVSEDVLFLIYKPGYSDLDGKPVEMYLNGSNDAIKKRYKSNYNGTRIDNGVVMLNPITSAQDLIWQAKRIEISNHIMRNVPGYNNCIEVMARKEYEALMSRGH